jgi:hypothetical protein
MSRFYAEVENDKSKRTLRGFEKSGINAHIRGWDIGVRVYIRVDEKGKDEITIYKTHGSNDGGNKCFVAKIKGD